MMIYRYERAVFYEHGIVEVNLRGYEVIKETEKCYVISPCYDKKYVLKEGKKRFAYPTKEEALNNFKLRTAMCIKILRGQLKRAERYQEKSKEIIIG